MGASPPYPRLGRSPHVRNGLGFDSRAASSQDAAMHRSYLSIFALLTIAPLVGCSGSDTSGSGSASTGGETKGPTFHKDVEPILVNNCQTCHSPGRIAPFSLISYDDAKTAAG